MPNNRPIGNVELINLLQATVNHITKEANKQVALAKDNKAKTLAKAGFDEVLDGHFNILKLMIFIELVESNQFNLQHLEDLITEHITIINKELEGKFNDAAKEQIEYNKRLWETMLEKMRAYVELLNPVE